LVPGPAVRLQIIIGSSTPIQKPAIAAGVPTGSCPRCGTEVLAATLPARKAQQEAEYFGANPVIVLSCPTHGEFSLHFSELKFVPPNFRA
jgi:hypothetical protein